MGDRGRSIRRQAFVSSAESAELDRTLLTAINLLDDF